jgi:hypothetical protein
MQSSQRRTLAMVAAGLALLEEQEKLPEVEGMAPAKLDAAPLGIETRT